jgi:hypothetical protein
VGKRGSRSRKRPSVHERRAHKHAESEEYHKHRARIIGNSIIVAAIWTVANILAYGYGVLPYPYSYFAAFQFVMLLCYAYLGYLLFMWNRKCPVYRETYWMLFIFVPVAGTVTSWPV